MLVETASFVVKVSADGRTHIMKVGHTMIPPLDVDPVKRRELRRIEVARAVEAIQRDAVVSGTNLLFDNEIDAEIKEARRSRRSTVK